MKEKKEELNSQIYSDNGINIPIDKSPQEPTTTPKIQKKIFSILLRKSLKIGRNFIKKKGKSETKNAMNKRVSRNDIDTQVFTFKRMKIV
jgi:hypothetical protein